MPKNNITQKTKKKYNIKKAESHIKEAFKLWKKLPVIKKEIEDYKSVEDFEIVWKKSISKLNKLDIKIRNLLNKCPSTIILFLKNMIKLFENYEPDENIDDSVETLSEILHLICQHKSEYVLEKEYSEKYDQLIEKDANQNIVVNYQGPYW